jgi:hypothetical protein
MRFWFDLLVLSPRCRASLRSAARVITTLPNCRRTLRGSSRTTEPCARLGGVSQLLLFVILLTPLAASADERLTPNSPAFTTVPELHASFDLLYEQKFGEARFGFERWERRNPREPFGEVAIAASYLFEEFYRQNVLTSDFFLNDKRFLGGIEGTPDALRLSSFREHLNKARELARTRQRSDPNDGEALFTLTLIAGMESDALAILEKKPFDALKRMKEASKYSKQLLAHYPDATDAYIAPGMANYIVGSLGSVPRIGLRFGGIHGDKKLGMEQMSRTAASGRYLGPFAKIVLALAARRENQSALAGQLLLELREQYPHNALYAREFSKVTGPANKRR